MATSNRAITLLADKVAVYEGQFPELAKAIKQIINEAYNTQQPHKETTVSE
jgi:hypothetical protein